MKILIIRLSSIGDIVLTTPLWRCVHEQLQAEVHLLTKPAFAGLAQDHPHIHRVHHYTDEPQLLQTLRAEGFDHCLDLHNNWRSWRLRRQLNCPSTTFPKLNLRKWLLVNLGWNLLPKKQHVIDRYFEAAAILGVRNDGLGMQLGALPPAPAPLPTLPFLALVIGATYATKRLPAESLLWLCQQLKQPLVLIGGKEDQALGQWLCEQSGKPILNTCGQYSLLQSASIIEQAKAVVAHDTGFMHIAAALGKPLLVVWGNTLPDFGFWAYYAQGQHQQAQNLQVQGLSCRPCSKLGSNNCPKKHFRCMKDQDLKQVIQWADLQWLG
jgi:ADP-heptose:LPS heptosyltransferase